MKITTRELSDFPPRIISAWVAIYGAHSRSLPSLPSPVENKGLHVVSENIPNINQLEIKKHETATSTAWHHWLFGPTRRRNKSTRASGKRLQSLLGGPSKTSSDNLCLREFKLKYWKILYTVTFSSTCLQKWWLTSHIWLQQQQQQLWFVCMTIKQTITVVQYIYQKLNLFN